MDEIVDDLMGLAETMREKNQQAGEFRETAIERLTEFLVRLSHSSTDPAYLTVYRKTEAGITLEVRNIDPVASLSEVCSSHSCCILISSTLSPIESFRRYYFGNAKVTTLSLPNAFPKENRLVACANDITTAFSLPKKDNIDRICDYIKAFSALKGNRACYFPSYQIMEYYARLTVPHMRGRKTYIEPRDAVNASAALNEFLSLPKRGESGVMFAVCGGKWSDGLDYRGEMLNGAMVIGLPLNPIITRVTKMTTEYFRHKFGDEGEFLCYTLPAVNRSLQALEGVLRSPEDRGVLVLGDKQFLEQKVRNALPGWIQEEMIECDVTQFRELIGKWKP